MRQALRPIGGIAARILKLLGYGWAALWLFIGAFTMIAALQVPSAVAAGGGMGAFTAHWLVKFGGPNVLLGLAAIWLGRVLAGYCETPAAGGVNAAAPSVPSASAVPKAVSAAAQAVLGVFLLFAIGLGWMFTISVIRNRGYAADLAVIRADADADAVLAHVVHADRVSVDWVIIDGSPWPAAEFRRPKEGIKRPLDKAGKPLGIRELRAEYRIVAFFRKFLTVSFDENNAVSGVKTHTLD